MKRFASLATAAFFLAVTVPLTAQAQMGQGMDVKPGVRAGVDFMTLGGDDVDSDNLDRRSGFMFGGFALVDFTGPFAVQPEITYIQKGAEASNSDLTRKNDYIEIPVLAKFQLPVSGPVSPNLFAGPTLGFNVTAELEDGDGNTQDLSDETSGTEFGFAFGGGVDIGLAAGTLMIDARYGLGLTSIDDTDADQSINNQGFMITAGFAF